VHDKNLACIGCKTCLKGSASFSQEEHDELFRKLEDVPYLNRAKMDRHCLKQRQEARCPLWLHLNWEEPAYLP
jgi:hypothetical protein